MKRIPVEYAILALAVAATIVIAFPAQAQAVSNLDPSAHGDHIPSASSPAAVAQLH